jgi:hypothetical protein
MKTSLLCTTFVAMMGSSGVHGFAPSKAATTATSTTQIAAEGDSRRNFFVNGLTYTAAALASTGVLAPLPANAASAEAKVNAKLNG